MKKIISIVFVLLFIYVICWWNYPGSSNQYYIEDIGLYIKTFSFEDSISRYANIVFSDKPINNYADSLDYVTICKGVNYYTDFTFDTRNMNIVYIRGNSFVRKNTSKYDIIQDSGEVQALQEKEKHSLHPFIVMLEIDMWGHFEEILLKSQDDTFFVKMQPIETDYIKHLFIKMKK